MTSSRTSSDGGPVFFWREYEEPYGFMSQWYPSTFTAPAPPSAGKNAPPMTFLTTEQYMMYQKAIVFKDQEIADKIMLEPNPRKQKALGRKANNFDNKKWNGKRDHVVEEGNWWKFTQPKEEDLRKRLLETGDRMLVEARAASPYDRIWGIGYNAANAESNRGDWGENLLGKALMRVRDRLRAEEAGKKDGTKENAEGNA